MPITSVTAGLSSKNNTMPSLAVSNFNGVGYARIRNVSVSEKVS